MRVGILIPTYNAEAYIEECINSALNQTFEDCLIYIVDDCSTDNTIAIINKYIKFTTRITFNKNSENSGFAATFNSCARMAIKDRCTHVFTLCNDDVLPVDAIEKMTNKAKENPESAWISCYGQMFGNDNKLMTVNLDAKVEDFKETNQLLSFALFKSEVWEKVGGYDEKFSRDLGLKSAYEDWEMWIRLIKAGYKYSVVQEALYLYRMRGNQLHNNLHPYHHQLVAYINSKHF